MLRIRKHARLILAGLLSAMFTGTPTLLAVSPKDATHKQIRSITPEVDGQKATLNTYCVGPDKNLWMCCAAFSKTGEQTGVIAVYSPDGNSQRVIKLDFIPTAINFAKSGDCFVAGSGKIAKLNSEGEVLLSIDSPNMGNREEMLAEMKKAAEEQIQQITESYNEQIKQIKTQLDKLAEESTEGLDEKKLARRERRQQTLEEQLKQYEEVAKTIKDSYSSMLQPESQLERVKRATGLAVSEQDVFVSLPVIKGYGYSIWRMNHDLKEPTQVLDNVGGCCGQLDIQTDGKDLLVAANTAFKVQRYDRDGKELASFGSQDRTGDAGFGSCCNPMNIRCVESGEILTAESSIGHIKRFSATGEYLGYVGTAKIGGGCKHVALGMDTERNWYYMMNIDKGNVAVLVPKAEAPGETTEEREAREAREGLGNKFVGTWEINKDKNSEDAPAAQDTGIGVVNTEEMFGNAFDYMKVGADGSVNLVKPQPIAATAKKQSSVFDLVSTLTGVSLGSDDEAEAATITASAFGTVTWDAVRQKDNTLVVMLNSDGTPFYGAEVTFISDTEATVQMFYDTVENKMGKAMPYKRTSDPAADCKECQGYAEKCATEAKATETSAAGK